MDTSFSSTRRNIPLNIFTGYNIVRQIFEQLAKNEQDRDKLIQEFIKFKQANVQTACERAGSIRCLSTASFADVHSWIIDGAAVQNTHSRERLRSLALLLHKAADTAEGVLLMSAMPCVINSG
jgi:hypothetical protein